MDLTTLFGSKVFGDAAMRKYLSREVYESLKRTQEGGLPLDPAIAEAVAEGMKDWAISLGATHYAHWFQPLTNITAGKHDSFIEPAGNGDIVLEFSPKALVKGEPDASSFPSGGLRATFEARGYTTWDPTSPAFVKDGTLYIPTAFCAYNGEALDQKTPLLRSMQAVNDQALRLLRLLGNTTSKCVVPTVGAEQEYFLIDRGLYEKRLDLKICGRTLIGAKPPKGQELDDHYCGRIRLRVADYMKAVDEELWALGIPSKTKHNEVAPAQHELASVFGSANITCDHNQLTMETLRVVAKQKGLACLLHEKPFAGINGSGKHNNYSLSTDDGLNLLSPSKDPAKNRRFLLVLAAFLEAVDDYADLLRASAACAGNDHRLGGCEAPPAIISVFLGENLTQELVSAAEGHSAHENERQMLHTGVAALPDFVKDDSDRNRTSPFAFTGNKFEFRMLGSSQSIALTNVVLNTALADVFQKFCDRLEKAPDRDKEIGAIIADVMNRHGRIIFNGNNYSEAWVQEAKRRGLPVLDSSVEAFDCLTAPKNIALFKRHCVFTEPECLSRVEILLENYSKVLAIESATMIEMVRRQVYPAVVRYTGELAETLNRMRTAGALSESTVRVLGTLTALIDQIDSELDALRDAFARSQSIEDLHEHAVFMRDTVCGCMDSLRAACDAAEHILDFESWPIPTYTDLLLRV
ncbi:MULTISPECIES: glutamine synthetase III family protein [Anaerotruncus]|jgi:glutamine synthetase|uniref:glutamine synthetase III family protein n=1 Tax=Anaerotruncus TaxID=244127 RepID=UPI00082EB89D|nr:MULTISPECIES: glutamine synthetase III [Anaerotruncus]RGX56367.1 glutamine synthetase type III [Anaerotruncus sp. AF02-27]